MGGFPGMERKLPSFPMAGLLQAEADENTCWKPFNPVEAVAIGEAIPVKAEAAEQTTAASPVAANFGNQAVDYVPAKSRVQCLLLGLGPTLFFTLARNGAHARFQSPLPLQFL